MSDRVTPPTDESASRHPRGFAHAFRDHLEAILIALAMALVLKQFCVEAFTIPTSSMHPTLIGENQAPDGVGDRILVDKFANWLRDPRRWEIWVFRFPLDRSRNFIKRVVGMPGDHLKIGELDGDIWIARNGSGRFEIEPKPRRVRESLYRPVYPPSESPERSKVATFRDESDEALFVVEPRDSNAFVADSGGRFEFAGGERAALVAANPIHTSSDPDSWHHPWPHGARVRDVRVRARFVPSEGATASPDEATSVHVVWSPDGAWEYRLALGPAGASFARITLDGEVRVNVPLEAAWDGTVARSVEVEAIDGRFHVWIDGVEIAVLPDGREPGPLPEQPVQRLAIEASGAPFRVEGLAVDRDIMYQNSWSPLGRAAVDGVIVPDGNYLMIGDNQGDVGDRREGSYDGRKWHLATIRLKDGTVIRHDDQRQPERTLDDGATWYSITDADGADRRWRPEDEDRSRPAVSEWVPFTSRDLFVGRAFFVFWPAFPDLPGRLRRVR